MIRKLVPIVLTVLTFLGGASAGEVLKARLGGGTGTSGPAAEGSVPADGQPPGGDASAVDPGIAPSGRPATGAPHVAEPNVTNHSAPGPDVTKAPVAGNHRDTDGGTAEVAWFRFPQQFLIPVLHDGRLDSTLVLSLSVEMPAAATEIVHSHEIKLRDAILRQLLIHANTGGFDGNFTSEAHLRRLRSDLVLTAQGVVPGISDILIGDIARQER